MKKLAIRIALITLVVFVSTFCAVRLSAQTKPAAPPAAIPSATPAKPQPVQLSPAQDARLVQLDQWIEARVKEYQIQKELVAQRIALELHLTAEQVDQMELVRTPDGYVFRPRPEPAPTPTPAGEKKP